MRILRRRLLVIVFGGLISSAAVGLLARDATTLVIGILVLGTGMVLAILFYLLGPIPIATSLPVMGTLYDWPEDYGLTRYGTNSGNAVAIHQINETRIIGRHLRVVVDNTNKS